MANDGRIEELENAIANLPSHVNKEANRYRQLLAVALLRHSFVELATDVFCRLDLTKKYDSYVPYRIAVLARSLGDYHSVSRLRNSLRLSATPIDQRVLTAIARGSDIREADDLYEFLTDITTRFGLPDPKSLHAFAEKFQVASRLDYCHSLEALIPEDESFKYRYSLASILVAHLEGDNISSALKIFTRWVGTEVDAESATWVRERLVDYGDSAMLRILDSTVDGAKRNSTSLQKLDIRHRSIIQRQRIRDVGLSLTVKRLYDGACQVCQSHLWSPQGVIAEAAHIQPLGAPHEGPDFIENLLCLCPNHHKTFDAHAWYLDDDLAVIDSRNHQEITKLLLHDEHPLSLACVRYRRRLVAKFLTKPSNAGPTSSNI